MYVGILKITRNQKREYKIKFLKINLIISYY